ncbi:MAG: CBS domain-containing protein [Anaerolineae bacterium]|jgi:CBS domain-containing protein/sporulation protein YlmC with PRC-barrel domain|nr:CBS domain-containing protein [Anaerolineae bacterium]MDH7474873.1 CBS domain-containing protein [Anaerolineae bacterium]
MAFLSQLQGKTVWDVRGERIGKCLDVLIADVDTTYPPIRALALSNGRNGPHFISGEQLGWLKPEILLTVPASEVKGYQPKGDELWLGRHVLDRQIVDVEGRRVVRVNDLQFARIGGRYCLVGADVGGMGLLRRLGVERLAHGFLSMLKREPSQTIIPWEVVAPLQAEAPIKLRISREKIGKLHPADIAEIVSGLDRQTGRALMHALDDETMAEIMEEIEPELQVAVLEDLDRERAADVLEKMDPDEAADLLSDLSPESSAQLLDLMEDEDAGYVRRLLTYPEESAGGIMTTEYATIPEGLTVAEAMDYLRRSEQAHEAEALYYIYVVDAAGRLKGVLDLRDLVLASPTDKVAKYEERDPITVNLETHQREVARIVAKYNLLAVPVVDEKGVLHGIVTVDDAVDAIIPTAWKKRLPKIF